MMAQFDDLDAYIAAVTGRMRADGILPDRRKQPREDDEMPTTLNVDVPAPIAPERAA